MRYLDTTFKRLATCARQIGSRGALARLTLEGGELSLAAWQRARGGRPARSGDGAPALADAALDLIPPCHMAGDARVRQEMLMALGHAIAVSPFVLGDNVVAFPVDAGERARLRDLVRELDAIFRDLVGARLLLDSAPPQALEVLEKRMAEASEYYRDRMGAWTEGFMDRLEDDLSRQSFATFLRQNIKCYALRGFATCYPVQPPAQSAAWRREREAADHDFPQLTGCADDLREFFLRDTFIYEQYAVPGVIEARPGDVVVDAGAFIGDTACYFSRKTGPSGRVYAFEAVPASAAFARENMRLNGCDNVEVLELALSDAETTFPLVLNAHFASASCLGDSGAAAAGEAVTVQAVPLDAFVAQRGTRVDFLKADIEGAELAMLHGAQETIREQAPVLALALYHKQEDFWRLPQYISELEPRYRFWFRCECEPVLFARRG